VRNVCADTKRNIAPVFIENLVGGGGGGEKYMPFKCRHMVGWVVLAQGTEKECAGNGFLYLNTLFCFFRILRTRGKISASNRFFVFRL